MDAFLREEFIIPAKNPSVEVLGSWRKLCGIVKNRRRRFRYTANLSKRRQAEDMRRSNRFGAVYGNNCSQYSMHLRSRLLPRQSTNNPLDNRTLPMESTGQALNLEGIHREMHGIAEQIRIMNEINARLAPMTRRIIRALVKGVLQGIVDAVLQVLSSHSRLGGRSPEMFESRSSSKTQNTTDRETHRQGRSELLKARVQYVDDCAAILSHVCEISIYKRPLAILQKKVKKMKRTAVLNSKGYPKSFVREMYQPPDEVSKTGFEIDSDMLSSIVISRNSYYLKEFFGFEGIARCLNASLDTGVSTTERPSLSVRKEIFGSNTYDDKPHKSFWTFPWDAFHNMKLVFLLVCAVVSVVLGTTIEGCPEGIYDALGIILCILVVVVGDVVHLTTGDIVPADGLFFSHSSLLVDESSLTGESESVIVNEENPFLFKGTKVQDGSGKMLVASVGMRTYWGSLIATMRQSGENKTPLQVKLKVGLTFSLMTFLVLTAGLVFGKALHNEFLEWSITDDALKVLNSVTIAATVLVAGVPEGMLLGEKLILAFRKDGMKTVSDCPTESALLGFAQFLGGHYDDILHKFKVLRKMPFDSFRKRREVCVACPEVGVRMFCIGAAEVILRECTKIVCNNGESVHFSKDHKEKVQDINNEFCCGALRTLCLAFRDGDDSCDDYTLIAILGISNPVRPKVKSVVQAYLAAGISVRMVTGDNINTAKAIARECGILSDDGLAIEASDLHSIGLKRLKEIIPKIQVVARCSPDDKSNLVTQLSKLGEVVAVTGDGTNDAPALRVAHVGLAMGIAGTEVWLLLGSTPLTALQLLWVKMISDILCVLVLVTKLQRDQLEDRASVGRNRKVFTIPVWSNISGQTIYQLAILFILTFCGKSLLKLSDEDAGHVLHTVIFNTFVLFQVRTM
ncbi:autoinhibited Ca(2+)-ATPase, isoform 4 [Actinidia rufa]|uniref:Autoinhibited Ca(2+)-ATPase, isoform 4 n=1 Tax=Actinidia rufa TaxID=165716 RepID=A0A7J0DBM4_9ERIC|nr:autoinhibited Ca(2+)-ATPase, isoform 4 [Actinidia rufa]